MKVFPTFISWSSENKSFMRVDESSQVKVSIRVFPTFISWSSENKSFMRIDESSQVKVSIKVFPCNHNVSFKRGRHEWYESR